jgi:hypothetical protein
MSQTSTDTESQLEALRKRVREALRGPLEDQWDEVLEQWSSAAPADREAVRAYVSGLRNRMLESLLEIGSLDELERGLAVQYIEVKCHWTMLNTQIQNQTAENGRPDDSLIYRATCVSLILQALEPLVSRKHVDGVTDFLVEPLE